MAIKMRPNPSLEHKPHGFSSMGEAYMPDKDGWIDIPKVMVETARAHGFVTADDFAVYTVGQYKSSADLTKGMTKRQMIAYCAANDLDMPTGLSVDGLRKFVTEHMADEAA